MTRTEFLRRGTPEMAVLLRWWHAMTSDNVSGGLRADRAILRRAASVQDVILTPAYQRLFADMSAAHEGRAWFEHEKDRIAAIVGLAAHLAPAEGLSLPEAMSKRSDGSDRNPVSELRFRRLLDSPDVDALFAGLRRTLPLIDHRADLALLAEDVFAWGDSVKKRWAYAYDWPKKA